MMPQPPISDLCPLIQEMPRLRMLRLIALDYNLEEDLNSQSLGHLFQATSALQIVYAYCRRGRPLQGSSAHAWKRGGSTATEAIWERKAWKGVYG